MIDSQMGAVCAASDPAPLSSRLRIGFGGFLATMAAAGIEAGRVLPQFRNSMIHEAWRAETRESDPHPAG